MDDKRQFITQLHVYNELLDYLIERLPEVSSELSLTATKHPELLDDPEVQELLLLIDTRTSELERAVFS